MFHILLSFFCTCYFKIWVHLATLPLPFFTYYFQLFHKDQSMVILQPLSLLETISMAPYLSFLWNLGTLYFQFSIFQLCFIFFFLFIIYSFSYHLLNTPFESSPSLCPAGRSCYGGKGKPTHRVLHTDKEHWTQFEESGKLHKGDNLQEKVEQVKGEKERRKALQTGREAQVKSLEELQ